MAQKQQNEIEELIEVAKQGGISLKGAALAYLALGQKQLSDELNDMAERLIQAADNVREAYGTDETGDTGK